MFQTVFKRYESKYFTDSRQYAGVLRALERYTKPDRYGRSRICSVYYDTPDRRLIRASLEKPVYKEKLRLRTYGVPQDGSPCFIEIKKKYKGIVYKRRITADYAQALRFLSGDRGCLPPSQIKSETDFFLSRYAPLEPAADIFYTRNAFYDRLDPGVRITFDSEIVCRADNTDLRKGDRGTPLLPDGIYLMEIKTAGAMPIWTAASLIFGLVLSFSHMFKNSSTKSYAVTVALLPLIVQTVIMLVNGNLGTGVAVAGAFSLVRFRSVPGSAKEILSIFMAMAAEKAENPIYCGSSLTPPSFRKGGRKLFIQQLCQTAYTENKNGEEFSSPLSVSKKQALIEKLHT